MPRSKRDKKVSLTNTEKKGLQAKQALVEEVRSCLDDYERVFIFSVCNMRNSKLKQVRNKWKQSRFFFGKNKVMALALGKSPQTEVMEGLHKLSKNLHNDVGVLFTNKSRDEVLTWFKAYSEHDFARAGNTASSTVDLNEGPLTQFSHAMEPHLRKLGLPVALKKGVITMLRDFAVCKDGEKLSAEQAKILKLLGVVMAQFSIEVLFMWDKTSKDFEAFEPTPREKVFNRIHITADDQEYDYVEENNNVSEMEAC